MKSLKKVKWNVIISAVIYVALGVILLLWPQQLKTTICYMVGGAGFVIGIVNLFNYLRRDYTSDDYQYNLVYGVVAILFGVYVFVRKDTIAAGIPVILAFAVTVSGLLKFQNAVDLIRLKYDGWGVVMIIALINIVYGGLMVVDPFDMSAKVTSICLGIGMIYSGVSDLIATIMLSKCMKKVNADGAGTQVAKTKSSDVVN